MVSKLNTVAQIVLAATTLGELAMGADWHVAIAVLVWTVAVTTLASGGSYIVQWSRRMSTMEGGR
jgi:cardiolipin synthase (CMP-forming)